MSEPSRRLIFFGNERLATAVSTTAPTLRALISAGYEIEAVVASHSDSVSRQKKALEIGPVAQAHHIPVILPGNKISLFDKLKHYRADAAVLVAYGQLIPKEVIDLFPAGIINIHPSLLPKLRGSTPIETAILDGLPETGVSLMGLAEGMDAGPVFAQSKLKLSGSETKQQLAGRLLEKGRDLLLAELPKILAGQVKAVSQNEKDATYTKKINKADGILNWRKPTKQLEREVRAYAGWPKSTANIFGYEVIITKAHISPVKLDTGKPGTVESLDNQILVRAADGYLCVDNLKPAGKAEMTAAEFIRGYKK